MSASKFQELVCRILAKERKAGGESYVAGGVPLSHFAGSGRISENIDIFHDTAEALDASKTKDTIILRKNGYEVRFTRDIPSMAEAIVSKDGNRLKIQWVRDSAYRFFPLVEDPLFGLVAHPLDLATNKVLALAGRMETRDWVDTIYASDNIQHLGLLAFAACGKDAGLTPSLIMDEAGRSSRYSMEEFATLNFDGQPPDFRLMAVRWKTILREAVEIISALPADKAGRCVMDEKGVPLHLASAEQISRKVEQGKLIFHEGHIGGVWPKIEKIEESL